MITRFTQYSIRHQAVIVMEKNAAPTEGEGAGRRGLKGSLEQAHFARLPHRNLLVSTTEQTSQFAFLQTSHDSTF